MPPNASLSEISAALPDRPITVRPPAVVGASSTAGVFVMLFAALAGVLWWLGPDLRADWRTGRDVVEARDATLGEAGCRGWLLIFTVCDVAFTHDAGTQAVAADTPSRTLRYFFIGTAGSEPIVLMRERGDLQPGAVTTNIGLAKLYQRLVTLALMVGFLVLCIAISAQMLRAGAGTRRALLGLNRQKLSALVVTMEGSLPVATRRRRWTYVYEDAGGDTQRAYVELHSRLDPLFMTPDRKRALALQGAPGGVPLLLDAQLSSLDLSDAEKEAFFAACRAVLERGQLG